MTAAKKPEVDWERIEFDFRAGLLSTREIAAAHGVSHTIINRRAKAEGWERDLSAKIKAKAEAIVSRQLVSSEVSIARLATERQVIEAGAERIAQVRGMQRGDITQARDLAMRLMAELQAQTSSPEDLAKLGEIMLKTDDKGTVDKLNELYHKVISLGSRTKTMKDLADTLRTLIALEREAYGIGEAFQPTGGGTDTSGMTDNAKARRFLFAITEAARLVAKA